MRSRLAKSRRNRLGAKTEGAGIFLLATGLGLGASYLVRKLYKQNIAPPTKTIATVPDGPPSLDAVLEQIKMNHPNSTIVVDGVRMHRVDAPEVREKIDYAAKMAREHGLPPGGYVKQIWIESRFKPTVGSSGGALGIAQFMPGTAVD